MAAEEPPPTLAAAGELPARVLAFWERSGVATRSVGGDPAGPVFRFTEGPPTANGTPHLGHVVARALKDLVLRYRRMRGERILSPMAGWDCHGLPVEIEVEKRHGIRSKREIEAYGVERFCAECRSSALEVADIWREMSRRLGYWLDYERAYRTMDAPYIESVWWALRTLYDRGLLEKGHYCLPYCPRCETSLSSHEVAQGYRETTDPSVTVRLRLHGAAGEPERYLLVWTTTPWTLPANLLVAARADLDYVGVRGEDGAEYLLAETALPRFFPEPGVVRLRRYVGRDLAEHRYDPPFPFAGPGERRFRVVLDDSVDPREGTGFVHIAPSFGPEDFRIGEREGVGVLDPLDGRGAFTSGVPPVAGRPFKAADPVLVGLLKESGALFRQGTVRHTYPFCWRCQTPLIYRALDSWFVRTRRFTEALVANNATVRWIPSHLREGRFGNFLTEAKDWALSRARYWGTPLPIWSCARGHHLCIGSFAELAERRGGPLPEPFDPHRVAVDAVSFPCPECGEAMQREPYTIDAWFDSGAAPFAQFHYPFEPGPFDPERPLDFVCEGLDQTRGWFYTMLVLATALFGRPAYRSCLTTGLVLDEQGQKMSKSRGNSVEPLALLAAAGGDAVRWSFYTSDYTEPMRLSDSAVRLAGQRSLGTLSNVLAFYRENALPPRPGGAPTAASGALLDRWLRSRSSSVVERLTSALDAFDARAGALALQELIADISTWYLRRSRPRFWSEEESADRRAADDTLSEVLGTLARLLAPFAPFTAEHLFQELSGTPYGRPESSVHTERWPAAGTSDPALLTAMAALRRWVEAARELRQRTGVKARIPLPTLVLRASPDDPARSLGPEGDALIREELNVRELRWESPDATASYASPEWVAGTSRGGALFLSGRPTPELYREGLVREALRRLQSARKRLGLGYTERIGLELWGNEPLLSALRAELPRLERELLASAPALAPLPAPEGAGLESWSFEEAELVARIRRLG